MLNVYCGLFNKSDEELAITSVTTEYQDKSGQWIPTDKCFLGSRWGSYDYSFDDTNNFNISSKAQQDMAIRALIKIDRPQFTARRRMHSSLPQPFVLRITFTDSNNATSVLTVTHINSKSLSDAVDSRKSEEERISHPVHFWVECDDIEGEGRIHASATSMEDDKYVEVCLQDRGLNLYVDDVRKLAFEGVRDNKTEVELKDKWEEKSCSVRGYALIDLKNKRAYALKFNLKTATSSATDYYLLPVLKSDS